VAIEDLQQNDNPEDTVFDYDPDNAILKDLNPSQIKAVTQLPNTVMRVIAGPGSGKTRVLTCRMAHLLVEASRRDRILGVTFTRKAAGEMQERLVHLIEKVVKQQDNGILSAVASEDEIQLEGDVDMADVKAQQLLQRVTLGTFHSICAKILRWNGDLLATLPSLVKAMPRGVNLDGAFAVIDEAGQLRLLRDCLNETNIDLEAFNLKPKPLLSLLSDCKAQLAVGANPFEQTTNSKPLSRPKQIAQKVLPLYQEKLVGHNCLDFDDLIYFTRELLQENRDVRERLQRYWKHVLIDEFQDTSRTQMDIVKLLTTDSLFIVGDADQSIYSWRGAHVGSLHDFEDEYQDIPGGVQTVYLMENYRSTGNIVKAAQKVISHTQGKSSSARVDSLRRNMKPKRESGGVPRIVVLADDRAEAAFVVKTVKESMDAGKFNEDQSVAVLYRTNAQSRALEEACVKENIPYVIFGSATSFYKRQEIRDCLCFLRWLYNGRDRVAMLRAIQTPKRGIGDRAIQEFDAYCAEVEHHYEESVPGVPVPTPLDVLFSFTGSAGTDLDPSAPSPVGTISKRTYNLLKDFSIKLRQLHEKAQTATLSEVLTTLIRDFELIPHLNKISNSVTEFEERKANVQELQQATSRYEGACSIKVSRDDDFVDSPLGAFLDDVALVTDMSDNSPDDRLTVKLMTIHASKGMEFDMVFVVGNEDGTFPTSQAIQEGDGSVVLEEEKRLCYVAMTRAKSELILTWRKEVSVFTSNGMRSTRRGMSRFLEILVGKKNNKGEASASEKFEPSPTSNPNFSVTSSAKRQYYSAAEFKRKGAASVYAQRYKSGKSRDPTPVPVAQAAHREFTGTTSVYAPKRNQQSLFGTREASPHPTKPRIPNVVARLPSQPQTSHSQSASRSVETTGSANNSPRISKVVARLPLKADAPHHSDSSSMSSSNRGSPASHEQKSPKSPEPETSRGLSSTLFYPVGSQVVHEELGKGTVQTPPSTGDPMAVQVLFANGQKGVFDATGTDLAPV
jgi:DNA helicase-2/ATP-dependent DNA helicase PcrA